MPIDGHNSHAHYGRTKGNKFGFGEVNFFCILAMELSRALVVPNAFFLTRGSAVYLNRAIDLK